MGGLRDGLMLPEAYAQFKAALERNLSATQGAVSEDLRLRDRRIAETEKVKANLLRAVESGTFSEVLINRLNEVDAELEEIRAQRAAAEPQPVDLPEDLPALWRAHVKDLAETLSEEGVVGRAANELREKIDAVVVRYDATAKSHRVELRGKLFEMLQKANPAGGAGYVAALCSLFWLRGQDL
ncbi:recombinase family protein, partial [Cereibacter sphaeroides]|nr:recombinase family protein [Cereibacter sphaeroides]